MVNIDDQAVFWRKAGVKGVHRELDTVSQRAWKLQNIPTKGSLNNNFVFYEGMTV